MDVWAVNIPGVGLAVSTFGEIAGFDDVAMAGEDHDLAGVFVAGDADACFGGFWSIRHAAAAPTVAGATGKDVEIDFRRAVEDLVVAGVVCEVVEPGQVCCCAVALDFDQEWLCILAMRQGGIIVIGIHDVGHGDLLGVVGAGDAARLVASLGQGWQEHGRQDGDDGDDDKKFNQSKSLFGAHGWLSKVR